MAGQVQKIEIGILIYPNVLQSAVHGVTDLLQVASRLSLQKSAKAKVFRVTHWKIAPGPSSNASKVYDSHPDLPKSKLQVVIVPPSLSDPLPTSAVGEMVGWLRSKHQAGAILCSVCSGAFILAETGILDGRVVTTHWTYANEFSKRFPDIQVESDRIAIDEGDVITAGGLMAWTDLGLGLVAKFMGPTVMLESARFMLMDPPGREQRYYSRFSPVLLHGDGAILKVQHWLQAKAGKGVDVPAMATKAGLEERTFLRRFVKATGLKPTEYCQQIRVNIAREKLEFTNSNVDEIAWLVGYEDAGAFRKIFQRVVGLSPGEYRSRFGQ